jgi:hypothetical protein
LKALESAKNTGDGLYVATALHKIVNYYENYDNQPQLKTDWELASKYLLEAKHILDTTPPRAYHHYLLAEGYRELAELAGDLGRWEQAPEFAEAGLKSTDMFFQTFDSSQFDNLPERMMYYGHAHTNQGFLYGAFMGYYSVMGDIEKAGEFNEKSTEALHRYDKKQLSLKIILLQREYENELLARDARLLETDIERKSLQLSRTRLILILIGGSSLFIILFLYWYFQRIRLKSSLKILETEHALLRSQMNPHFLFNMITSIQNFIVKEQPQKASLFLSRFSKLVRNILDHSSEEFIPLEKEIETLEHYLELQKNRYGDLFEYTISIDEQLDEFNTRIPAMMLQPFIENAIDHGIKPKKAKGQIDIRFVQKGEEIWVEVEDNGIGRAKAAELESGQIHNKHLSRATFLIQQRINVLNRKYHIKIYFEIIDLENEKGEPTGTLVRIILPKE